MENEELLVLDAEKAYNIRHRCFHFAKDVILFISESKFEKIYFSLFDQLLRSACSIGANIVEGGSGSTKKDFINFLSISLKSANETKYWLCLIRDTLTIDKAKINLLLKEATEISKIIAAIIMNSKNHL